MQVYIYYITMRIYGTYMYVCIFNLMQIHDLSLDNSVQQLSTLGILRVEYK